MCAVSVTAREAILSVWLVLTNPFSSSFSDLTFKVFKQLIGFLITCKAHAGRSVAREAEDNPVCEVFFCISTECDVQPEFSFGDEKYIYYFRLSFCHRHFKILGYVIHPLPNLFKFKGT